MSDSPLITVVIPSYNSAGYIEETLHSLAIQTFKDFEVIVIDDHSSDDTLAIAEAAHKKMGLRGRVMRRPDDVIKGVASCRNLGVEKAQGEWVSFLDSDDLFLPEKLSATAKKISQYGDSCFAYFHSSRQFEDGTGKTLQIQIADCDSAAPEDIFDALTRNNFVTTSSVTLKKSLVDEIGGFDTSLHGIEDYMLWLRAAKRTKWQYMSEMLTDYRIRLSSLMGGREMIYYVGQNLRLISAIERINEFKTEETAAIERYVFDETMQYYSMVSLKTRGWGDFLKGLKSLHSAGKMKLAKQLFFKHFKFAVLNKVSLFKKIIKA